jgi:hypothetical protein
MASKVTFISSTKTIKFNSGVRSVDFQTDVYSAGKLDWLTDAQLHRFIFPVRSIGGNPLPGGKIIEPTFFLRNGWQMEPDSADHEVTIYGNVYSDDNQPIVKLPAGYSVIVNLNTTTSPESTDTEVIQRASESIIYGDGVTLNANSVNTGTEYPIGTSSYPVNNLTDAKLIATSRGFSTFYLASNFTVTASDDISNYVIEGKYHDRITLTLETGCNITNTQFNNLTLVGDAGSSFCVLQNSRLGDIQNLDANVYQSELMGPISLSLGADRHWTRCTTSMNTDFPVLDFQSTDQSLVLTGYTGNLKVTNMTLGLLSVYVDSGAIEVDSTCTGGVIHLYGNASVTNNSVGTTVINETIAGATGATPSGVAVAVWDEPLSGHTTAGTAGRTLKEAKSKATLASLK